MRKLKLLTAGLAASGALLGAAGAVAQNIVPIELPTERNTIGAGAFAVPDFYGAEDFHAEGTAFLHANLGYGTWLQLIGPELRVNLVPNFYTQLQQFRGGIVYRARPNRNADMGDEVVRRMRRIPWSTELGVFASYTLPLDTNLLHKIVFSGDATWSTNSVYNGAVGTVKATYFHPFAQNLWGRSVVGSAGVGLFFASDHFTSRYFGIENEDVLLFPVRGGVPYRPEGGLASVRIPFSLSTEIYPNWSFMVSGRYERLLEDAADSPLVRQRGNENQWTVGATVSYLF